MYTGESDSPVVNKPRSLDSPVVNTPKSLDSPVMNTLGRFDFLVFLVSVSELVKKNIYGA